MLILYLFYETILNNGIVCGYWPRLDLYVILYYLSNTSVILDIDNAISSKVAHGCLILLFKCSIHVLILTVPA